MATRSWQRRTTLAGFACFALAASALLPLVERAHATDALPSPIPSVFPQLEPGVDDQNSQDEQVPYFEARRMVMDAIAEHGAQGRLAAPTRSDVGSTAIILGWTGETPDWLTNAAEIAGAKTGIVVVIKSARHTQDELMSIVSDKLHPLAPVGALTDIAIDIDRIVVRGANLPELSARRDTVATDWFPFFAKVDELSRIGIVVDFESRDQLRYQP